jgi:hypothetical protein
VFRARWLFMLLGFAMAACVATPTAPSPTTSTAASPSQITAAIVGEWRGEHECQGIADALSQAGFGESVIIGTIVDNGLLPGVTDRDQVTNAAQPCEGAITLEHSHEFTADGQFFSYNQQGDEVDFGTYELVDDDTLVIGAPDREDMTFDFSIDADRLTLEPQLPEGCMRFVCQWAIMVAMSWSTMERVDE